jgi:hypothetical protein
VLIRLSVLVGIGLLSLVFIASFMKKSKTGMVRQDQSQQTGDWSKTRKAAQDRAVVEKHIEKQVDVVKKMEKDLESLQIKPPKGGWNKNGGSLGFLDPAEPVRQYVKYRHDKAKGRWKDSDKYPDMYANPFENTRTGKQWHDQFGKIVRGKPARYRSVIEQHVSCLAVRMFSWV